MNGGINMLYLYVEDFVPNAIIELNRIDGSRNVLIDDARRYGLIIADYLNQRGYFTKLKESPESYESFEVKYGSFFQKYYQDDTYGYRLQDDKSIDDIKAVFREPIALEVVDSFSSDEVIDKSFSNRM